MYNEYEFKNKELYFKHNITPAENCSSFAVHTHNMYELLYFVSGNATYAIEDKRYKLKKGDLMLIRPLKYHFIEIEPTESYERYDILFDERALGVNFTDMIPDDIEVINISENPVAAEIFQKLDLYSSKLSKDDFFSVLLLLINELFYALKIGRSFEKREIKEINPTLSAALRYINDNLFSLQSISEVADALFITESYLYRLFAKELKKTPKAYLREKRLLAAEDMISKGAKPTEIFSACGFLDYTVFYRNYKSFFGKSPSSSKIK